VGEGFFNFILVMNEQLTEENFLIFCAKVYDNPGLKSTEEFIEDLDRIKYIKKLLTRYAETGDLKERLILNHIITLHNCFNKHLAKILYLKTEKQFHYLKPFLLLINALPEEINNVAGNVKIYTDSIPLDDTIVTALRKIKNNA
jgi:hypothetical protein